MLHVFVEFKCRGPGSDEKRPVEGSVVFLTWLDGCKGTVAMCLAEGKKGGHRISLCEDTFGGIVETAVEQLLVI